MGASDSGVVRHQCFGFGRTKEEVEEKSKKEPHLGGIVDSTATSLTDSPETEKRHL